MASTGAEKAAKVTRKVRTYRSTDAEERRIAACAEVAGLPRCTWVREAAKRALPRFAKDDRMLLRALRDQLRAIGNNLNQLVHLAHSRKIHSSRSFRDVLRDLTAKVDEQRDTLDRLIGER
ncbi:MAG: MobC family plasmid mobilization relaxosome protein [Thermoanaerobaculia bacterium]|nr:MobC family plasmid mobilization relaxosome protein [Thermoanaerobaculia bacterium]